MGCTSQEDTSYVGTWEIDSEEISDTSVQVYLSPDQTVYIVEDSVAYEIPIRKVSDEWELPENLEIISLGGNTNNDGELSEQPRRAIEAEAQTMVGSMNRAQQAFRLENRSFAGDLEALESGVAAESEYYTYEIISFNEAQAIQVAYPKNDQLRTFVGIVDARDGRTQALLCRSTEPGNLQPIMAIRKDMSEPLSICPQDFQE